MTERASYRLPIESYPGMNPFVLDWMHGDTRFLPRGPKERITRSPIPADLPNALIESNRQWGLDVADEVHRWASGETFTVIAGQQAGFAGGPLYTIVKLLSLLKMKRDNEANGIPTTVFFWVATEDHDFDEVATLALPRNGGRSLTDLVTLRARRAAESKQIVGPQAIPEQLISQLQETLKIPRPKWLRKGIPFGDSFAELLATAVDAKFIVVDSLLPELRRAGAPLLDAILRRWNDVQDEIATRSDAMVRSGYKPPVTPRPGEGYTLLFRVDAQGNREVLHAHDTPPRPEQLSTSALTRPLLQDYVLSPDLFLGGPAEVTYFAQIAPLHRLLDVQMPRVALRGHVLCAPARVVRIFEKYGIEPEEVFKSPDQLLAAHEPAGVTEIRAIASEAERRLNEDIEKIRELALPADHAVARSINRSIGHINYHFRKLTERSIRGLVRKDRDRYTATCELVSTFFPDHHVQDRIVAWLPFWLGYGKDFIDRVTNETEPDAPVFKIVSL
jgi:uncharacterized protein YllA (UPF0747 family)